MGSKSVECGLGDIFTDYSPHEGDQHNSSDPTTNCNLDNFEFNISLFEICLIEKVFQHLRSLLKFLNSPKSNQLLRSVRIVSHVFTFYLN